MDEETRPGTAKVVFPESGSRIAARVEAVARHLFNEHFDVENATDRTRETIWAEYADVWRAKAARALAVADAVSGPPLIYPEAKVCRHWPKHRWIHHAPGFKRFEFPHDEAGCEDCAYCVRECHEVFGESTALRASAPVENRGK